MVDALVPPERQPDDSEKVREVLELEKELDRAFADLLKGLREKPVQALEAEAKALFEALHPLTAALAFYREALEKQSSNMPRIGFESYLSQHPGRDALLHDYIYRDWERKGRPGEPQDRNEIQHHSDRTSLKVEDARELMASVKGLQQMLNLTKFGPKG